MVNNTNKVTSALSILCFILQREREFEIKPEPGEQEDEDESQTLDQEGELLQITNLWKGFLVFYIRIFTRIFLHFLW